jgi:hypothetical protein
VGSAESLTDKVIFGVFCGLYRNTDRYGEVGRRFVGCTDRLTVLARFAAGL